MEKANHEVNLLPEIVDGTGASPRKSELDRYIQHKVAEIIAARDEFAFEPFFRLRRIANEMLRIQTIPERRKWQVFYQRNACMRCKSAARPHIGNGLCTECYPWVLRELNKIIREAQNAIVNARGLR
jgi:hypothetical protein